jgi:phosphoribosylanthranilate isomerase
MGVDAVGVIAVPASPRYVAPEQRGSLFAAVGAARSACAGVLVVADPGDDVLGELAAGRGHQVVQLHGNESVERCAELRGRLDVKLWKAVRIRRPTDLAGALEYASVVDALLLDAWQPDQLGGTGQRLPVEWLLDFTPPLPWWLAGGITPEHVDAVLDRLHPDGIDCSSGVERAPGDKDLARVMKLVGVLRARRGGTG